jgi:hypothetical protein
MSLTGISNHPTTFLFCCIAVSPKILKAWIYEYEKSDINTFPTKASAAKERG